MALSPASSHGTATTVATDTIWDAKGDMVSGTGPDTAARTAVGADGTIWTADAASTGGAKWAAAGSGAITLLSTTTLGSPATFDVSAISGSYNDLILVLIARGVAAAQNDNSVLRLNNDSGSNYYRELLQGAATTASAQESVGISSVVCGVIPGATATANTFGIVEITIPGYASTTWLKVVKFQSYASYVLSSTNIISQVGGGTWNNTAAVTRVTLLNGGFTNFATGSQLRIYGRL